jgi:putative transposase
VSEETREKKEVEVLVGSRNLAEAKTAYEAVPMGVTPPNGNEKEQEGDDDDTVMVATSPLLATEGSIRIGDFHPRVLIDSGCNHCLITRSFAEKARIQTVTTDSQITMQFADEKCILEPLVKASKVPIAFLGTTDEEVNMFVDFQCSENLKKFDVVLGTNLLKRLSRNHSLHIDFDTLELSLRQDANSKPINVVLRHEGDRKVHIDLRELMSMEVIQMGEINSGLKALEEEFLTNFPSLFTPVTAHTPSKLPHKLKLRVKDGEHLNGQLSRFNINPDDLQELKRFICDLEERGLIERSESRTPSAVFLIDKKGQKNPDGSQKKRCVIDFREKNRVTEQATQSSTALRAENIASMLARKKVYSTIDLKDGFFACDLADEETRDLTSFNVPTFGTWRWTRLPQGLQQSPEIFYKNVETILQDLKMKYPECIFSYMDDLCICTMTVQENLEICQLVFGKLLEYDLKVNKDKVNLFRDKVQFLGYEVTHDTISMRKKAQDVSRFQTPKTKKDVRSFTSFASFFRAFIPGLAKYATPLYAVQGTTSVFKWGDPQQKAFEKVRDLILNLENLKPPSAKRPSRYLVYSDGSDHAIGGHLAEMIEGKMRPLGFFSQALPSAAKSWSSEEKELCAMVKTIEHFEHIIKGTEVTVLCDNKPLVQALNRQTLQSEKAKRLVCKLLEFRAEVQHHEGLSNISDFASRSVAPAKAGESWTPAAFEFNHIEAIADVAVQLDPSEWTTAYEKDDLSKKIIEVLSDAETVGHAWRKKYEMKGELLYMREAHGYPARLVVPNDSSLRQKILSQHHDSLIGGHGGVHKTLARLTESFFWPKMEKTVRDYVSSCLVCARAKPLTAPHGPLHASEVPSFPFEVISMDLVTGLPSVPWYNGQKKVTVDSCLTLCCVLTRYVVFVPVPKKMDSEDVAEAIIQHLIIGQGTGVPRVIRSDRDVRWTSQVMKNICRSLGIRLALSTAHHASSNGSTETLNNVLGTYLRANVNAHRDNWPQLLPMCAMFYNTSKSTALNMSPSEARFGIAITFPIQIKAIEEGEESEPLARLRERQKVILQCARDTMGEYKDIMIKGSANQHTRALQVGDSVMVDAKALLPKNLHVVNRKTNQRFLGPYTVIGEVAPGYAYKVQLPPTSRAHPVFNISFLKKILITDEFDGRPEAQGDPQEELMDYIVEKVISHRRRRGELYFLVRWNGYGSEYDSWEPDLSFRQDDGTITNEILLEYLSKHKLNLS